MASGPESQQPILCLSPQSAVTFSPAIPYSWQVSRIETGRLIDQPDSRRSAYENQTRSNIYLPMAAMILTAALAVPAAAQNQVPFKGAMQGNDTDIGFTDTTVTVLQWARELAPMWVNSHSPKRLR